MKASIVHGARIAHTRPPIAILLIDDARVAGWCDLCLCVCVLVVCGVEQVVMVWNDA